MTDYNPPDDTEIATSKAIKATTGRRLRDMSIAITEGATGAPRITQSALMAPESGTDYSLGSGSFSVSDNSGSSNDTKALHFVPVNSGVISYEVNVSSRSVNAGGQAYVELKRNSSTLETWSSTGVRTGDITYTAGDSIYLYIYVFDNDDAVSIAGTYSFTSGTDCVRITA